MDDHERHLGDAVELTGQAMKYDDASWHYGGDFPDDLPDEAGATHAGMFLAWALLNNLGGSLHVDDFAEEVAKLRAREVTPGTYFLANCDGKLTDEDLDEDGNAFAAAYFDTPRGGYIDDYIEVLAADLPSVYHAPDTWESFDRLSPVVDSAFAKWRDSR